MTEGQEEMHRPSVLFVCVKNGGKSQMAAGLVRHLAGTSVAVDSAGTHPGDALNSLSVESLTELGIEMAGQRPQALTPEMVDSADLVVVLGTDAHVDAVGDTPLETWEVDEPSLRGIEGMERMRLVRDSIAEHVESLLGRLDPSSGRSTSADGQAG